jgi:signal transduction histidine kinase
VAQKSVLIIEQDKQVIKDIGQALHEAGYKITVAKRALEGLDNARTDVPDVIITDLDLPDMSGRELATTLRADGRFSNTPIVIILEEDTNVEQRELSLVAGVTGFLEKPINPEAIALQIEFYLSGGEESVDDDERLDEARSLYMQEFVTRLEKRIRDLETRNEDLRKLDQMKDSFIQLTAHELRTPLTLITGYSRLLQDHEHVNTIAQKDEGFGALVNGLGESITRMQSIVEEVLTISRIMTSQIELSIVPLNIADLVEHILSKYELALIERQLTVYYERDQWPSKMRGDADLLQLSIDNLISNAIKYTPNGGTIKLHAQHTEKLLRFEVEDSGIGIPPERHQQIFERFHIGGDVALHTTSKTAFGGGGLGLGLAICRGIIEAHGGKIRV